MAAKRKLWISDGMYSVHIVILPEEKSKGSIYSSTAQAPLAGSNTKVVLKCFSHGSEIFLKVFFTFNTDNPCSDRYTVQVHHA